MTLIICLIIFLINVFVNYRIKESNRKWRHESKENMEYYLFYSEHESIGEILINSIVVHFGFLILPVYLMLNGIKILNDDYSFFDGTKFKQGDE